MRHCFRRLTAATAPLVLVAALLSSGKALAEDYYFITIYGAQRPVINQARYTHTWATLFHLNGCGQDLRTYRVESFTISWLAASLTVDPTNLHAQPGINLNLVDTLRWCETNRMDVAQFGPHQIEPELYELMLGRWRKLQSGHVRYRASDLLNLNRGIDEVCNCIYAVLDFDGRDPAIRPVTIGFGFKASAFVTRRLHPWMVNPDSSYPCVSEMIGVKNYPTIRVGVAAILFNYPDGGR